MTKPAVLDDLTPTLAKVLRYVVTASQQPVTPERLVVKTAWSDLPHTPSQALRALATLHKLKLVDRRGTRLYTATAAGRDIFNYINKEGLWQAPPPRSKTNRYQSRKEKKK